MAHEFSTSYVKDSIAIFRQYKGLADRAIEQIADEQLHATLDPESRAAHKTGDCFFGGKNFLLIFAMTT